MNILVIGTQVNLIEAKQKFGETHHWQFVPSHWQLEPLLNSMEIVFDFIPEQIPHVDIYKNASGIIFFNTALITLTSIIGKIKFRNLLAFGFCGLPTFLNHDLLEVTSRKDDQKTLEEVCKKLNTDFAVVADRIGLVTPRIICMIINEAYYTVEEGTATREDIDLAMKLGTNYPYGPFEWGERIGENNVCMLLNAVLKDTGDERYSVCDLLMKEANKK
ncbi:MAG: 3-hydroxyacyl-CoA dehydrogenase [Cyclobacteriaceae bacterium]|nr:3-hydroxyacyl-CoA dehydrogenase [Cyclobacteriaceae bacterium]